MKKRLTLSVVIPVWNSEAQLKANLPAVLRAAAQVEAEVIIVEDKGTKDHSLLYLQSLGNKIRLYQNQHNEGFAASVNRGVVLAQGDIVVLLNTDVRPKRDCLQKARQYFRDDTLYALGFNSGEAWMGGEWQHGLFHHFRVSPQTKKLDHPYSSLWASGGQAAFSRAKWIALGGMDLLFQPFYWEDTDMGYRAWKRGWHILWAPECQVVHQHRKSVIKQHFTKSFIFNTAQRNQFIFIWKNISDRTLLSSHLLRLPYYLFRYPSAVLNALSRLPTILRKREAEAAHWKRQDREILSLWTR